MRQSIFKAVAFIHNEGAEQYKDTFDFTAKEVYAVMREAKKRKTDENYWGDTFIGMWKDGVIPDNVVAFFMAYGATELMSQYQPGLNLVIEAENEEEEEQTT